MLLDDRERQDLRRLLGLSLTRKARLAMRLRRDRRISPLAKLPLALVVAYVVSPVNILPKWIPLLRRFDNLIIGALGLYVFVKLIPQDLLAEHLGRIEKRPRIVDTTARVRR